jgi:hypothetical protein
LPSGSTVVTLIFSSDETHLTNFSRDKKAWPVCMTIDNILSKTRNSPSMHANVIIVLLPVPPKFLDNKQKDDALRKRSHQIFREVINLILFPVCQAGEQGVVIDCRDSQKRLCFCVISAWIADHKEDTTLHNIMGNLCPVCEEDESRLGNPQSRPAPL